jgi:hypothetical protein
MSKWTMTTMLLCLAGLIVLSIILSACGPDLSPAYGRVGVRVSDNAQIFFKREVRGLNYDALVISPSDSLCGMPNAKTDYVFTGMGPFDVYYKVETGRLILFTHYAATPPPDSRFPVGVVQNELGSPDFDQLKSNADGLNLRHLEFPIDERVKCSE